MSTWEQERLARMKEATGELRAAVTLALEAWVEAKEHGRTGDWIVFAEVDGVWLGVTSQDDPDQLREKALWAKEKIDNLLAVLPE